MDNLREYIVDERSRLRRRSRNGFHSVDFVHILIVTGETVF